MLSLSTLLLFIVVAIVIFNQTIKTYMQRAYDFVRGYKKEGLEGPGTVDPTSDLSQQTIDKLPTQIKQTNGDLIQPVSELNRKLASEIKSSYPSAMRPENRGYIQEIISNDPIIPNRSVLGQIYLHTNPTVKQIVVGGGTVAGEERDQRAVEVATSSASPVVGINSNAFPYIKSQLGE